MLKSILLTFYAIKIIKMSKFVGMHKEILKFCIKYIIKTTSRTGGFDLIKKLLRVRWIWIGGEDDKNKVVGTKKELLKSSSDNINSMIDY